MGALDLKPGVAAVAAVAVSSTLIVTGMGIQVGKARRKYDIKYPQMYADKDHPNANEFNCVQRGHQNTLEGYPIYLILQVVSAVEFPLVSAALGAIYWGGKIAYFIGYASGDPAKRMKGAVGYIGLLGMLGLSIKSVFKLAQK